jgi:hypothetical protein
MIVCGETNAALTFVKGSFAFTLSHQLLALTKRIDHYAQNTHLFPGFFYQHLFC